MPSDHVSLWVPIIVALVGFAGVLAAQVIANRSERQREDQRWAREKESRAEARSDRRRQELADAIVAYASSVTSLRRAEFNRGKERIGLVPEAEREPARQDTYHLRAEAESKMYLVSLLSDQEKDRDLVSGAAAVIEMCHQISARSVTEGELHERDRLAKESLHKLIEEANRRLRSQ